MFKRFASMSEVQAAGEVLATKLARLLTVDELQDLIELIDANDLNQDLEYSLGDRLEEVMARPTTPLSVRTLEVHENPEGVTIPLYRDNDLRGDLDAVRMAYVTTVDPGSAKGPILHRRRRSTVMCVGGDPWLTHMGASDELIHVGLHEDGATRAVEIPPGVPVRYSNRSPDGVATFFVLTDYAWRPNDDEAEKFDGWDDFLARGRR